MKPSFPRAPQNQGFVESQTLILLLLPSLKITSKILQNTDLFFLISFMQISFQSAVQSDNVITELNKNKGAGELVGTLGKGRCFPNELRRDVGSQEAETTHEAFSPSVGMKCSQKESPVDQSKAKFSV